MLSTMPTPLCPQISPFTSLSTSFSWVFVTALTVGYGDLVPTSVAGRAVACVLCLASVVGLAFPVGVLGGEVAKAYAVYTAVVHSHTVAMQEGADESDEGDSADDRDYGGKGHGDEDDDEGGGLGSEVDGGESVSASRGFGTSGSVGLYSTDIVIDLSSQAQAQNQAQTRRQTQMHRQTPTQTQASQSQFGDGNGGSESGGGGQDGGMGGRPVLDEAVLRDIVQQAVATSVMAMMQQQQQQLQQLQLQLQVQQQFQWQQQDTAMSLTRRPSVAGAAAASDDPAPTTATTLPRPRSLPLSQPGLITAPRLKSTSSVATAGSATGAGAGRRAGRRGSHAGSMAPARSRSFTPGDAKERAYGEYYAKVRGS